MSKAIELNFLTSLLAKISHIVCLSILEATYKIILEYSY